MKYSKIVVATLFAIAVTVSAASVSLACKSLGASKHLGIVTQVDHKANTVTIKDAEMGHLMTFKAAPEAIKDLKVGQKVILSYEEREGTLFATDIRV